MDHMGEFIEESHQAADSLSLNWGIVESSKEKPVLLGIRNTTRQFTL